jgi:hypothetical protein
MYVCIVTDSDSSQLRIFCAVESLAPCILSDREAAKLNGKDSRMGQWEGGRMRPLGDFLEYGVRFRYFRHFSTKQPSSIVGYLILYTFC